MALNQVSRRQFIQAGVTGAAVATLGCNSMFADDKKKRPLPIGVQLYSVRDECKKDFAKTVEQVAKIGYEAVEFAGYYNYKAKDLRKLLDNNGLKCCGAHIGIDTLLGDNLKESIEFHKIIGNKFLIVPGLHGKYKESAKAWMDTARIFNGIAEKLKPHDMFTGYHNHTVEFKPMEGKAPWDIFFSNTNKDVVMQLDIGNCINGGADPVAFLKKYPGRAKTIHAKPFSKKGFKDVIGKDEAPWAEIVKLCRTVAGTEWMIVEQEQYEKSSLESIKEDLIGLRKFTL